MLSLHTNAASLSTQNSLATNNKNLTASMSKLGTGLRVNSAMDDAAGLQIATRLNSQSRGMQVAQKNTQNGISMLQTAEGSMSEIGNMLLRMKDLATEAANGTSTQADRDAMQAEYGALGSEISNILKNTSFAGSNLFSNAGSIGNAGNLTAAGTLGSKITFQVGATSSETVELEANATGGSLKNLFTALNSVSTKIGQNTGAGGNYAVNAAAPVDITADEKTLLGTPPANFAALSDPQKATLGAGVTNDTTYAAKLEELREQSSAFGQIDRVKASVDLLNSTYAAGGLYANQEGFAAAQAEAKAYIEAYNAQHANYAATTPTNSSGSEISATNDAARGMIETLSAAINAVGTFRSDLGAVANRLNHTYNNLSNMITNTETAKGRIMDVDYATETSNMTKNQMLMQASSAMLKQSNSMSQMVSSLLQ